MKIEANLLYTETHEWVRREGNQVVVGITDFAQSELGAVVFIDLPEEGDEIEAGEEFGEIESHKAVSELKAPISGDVLEVNEGLEDADEDTHPVNIEPYQSGWLIKVQLADESELGQLLDAEAYKKLIS